MISDDSFDSTSSPDELYEDVDDTITETDTPNAGLADDQVPSNDPDEQELAQAREAFESDEPISLAAPSDGEASVAHSVDRPSSDSGNETVSSDEDPKIIELGEPFVGKWNQLISTTNWDKGKIIGEWREALIDNGAPATEYSDEAWVRRVGGVTSPHVGRLRRVHDRFGSTQESYAGLFWSHFLAALDWDDAPLWLEGAARESWSVSAMREMRWQAHGAVDSQRPTNSQIVEVDLDEDVVLPAQGGGREKEYDDDYDGVAVGPIPEGPDFGDEEGLSSLESGRNSPGGSSEGIATEGEGQSSDPVQPFVGLPALPDDLADAIEMLKLSLLRHKSAGWNDVELETVKKYLDAMGVLIQL